VTITGVIKDYAALISKKKDSKISITVTDPYKIVYKPEIDRQGKFTLSFPKYFTQDVALQLNENQPIRLIVSPGDQQSYVIDPDVSVNIVRVSGSNVATNQNIVDFQNAKEAEWLKVYAHKRDPYLLSSARVVSLDLREIFNSETRFLEAYIKGHKVTDLFKEWSRVNVRYDYASRKTRIAGNSHQPVSDPEFFKEFPVDEQAALMTSNFIPYFNTVLLYEHFFSSYINSVDLQALPAFILEYPNDLDSAQKELLKELTKFTYWTKEEWELFNPIYYKYPDFQGAYVSRKADAFCFQYINSKTSGMVKEVMLANFVKSRLGKSVLQVYAGERLVREYKKCLPKGIYMKYLEEEFRSM
jgi:hypothetical protein